MTAVLPWTADLSGVDLLDLEDVEPVIVISSLVPIAAPATITESVLHRESHVMPSLTQDADGKVIPPSSYTITTGPVGTPHVWVNGVDITYLRGVPIKIGSYSTDTPVGESSASFSTPQITPFDEPGTTSDLLMFREDAPVDIALVDPDGVVVPGTRWCGNIVSQNRGNNEGSVTSEWMAQGALMQSASSQHKVPIILPPTDIGHLIPQALNRVTSRRYAPIAQVTTGIASTKRGAYGDTEAEYAQDLLSTAWTTGGQQWTIERTDAARVYRMATKPNTARTWTVSAGAPGIFCNLTRDNHQRVDAVYGRGVAPDGYSWANWKYPNLLPYDPPDYPWGDPSTVMTIGTTDAMTDTGNGVSLWQRRMVEVGIGVAVDRVYSSADANAARILQTRRGISVDGIVGPQTWNESWNVGTTGADLASAYRAPLAIRPESDPHLYASNGAITGSNPAYDPTIIVHDIDIDLGPGVAKNPSGFAYARDFLARGLDPGWFGTIDALTDPHEGSRAKVREGDRIIVQGYNGADDFMVHVASTSIDPDSGYAVSWTVDSKYRDAMTLSSIAARNRESRADPARRPGNLDRRSRQEQDSVVEFEGESEAGHLPRIAVNGDAGLWTVWPVFISQTGEMAFVDLQSDSPTTSYAVCMFGAPITSNQLAAYIGNPLASDAPLAPHADILNDTFGLIEGWGQSGQACGYYPGDQESGSLTGRFKDTGSLHYASVKGGWVWVGLWASTSTHIGGRFYPAPIQ